MLLRPPAGDDQHAAEWDTYRLGHADPSITLRVYGHVLDDEARHAAPAFAVVLPRE